MSIADMTYLPLSTFDELVDKKRIFLTYPFLAYRNVYLSYFLNRTQDSLVYYRVSNNAPIESVLENYIQEVQLTHPNFGNDTLKLLSKSKSKIDELAESLANNFNALPVSNYLIIYIDEFDRIELSDSLRNFVRIFSSNLANNVKLVINSRLLTHYPWSELINKGQVAILGTANRKNDLSLTSQSQDKPQLEIIAFGRGHAIVNGQEINNWDGALPRNLFFYFIDNHLVTRDQIFKVFWPNLNIKEATNVFHVTKRKITECISEKVIDNGNYELTQYANGFYTPSDKIIRHYDVTEFEEAVDKASMTFDDDEQAKLYRRAIEIYKGDYLSSIDMPWVVDRREKLQQLFVEALIGMARIHKQAKDYETSLGFFIRSLRQQPHREDIHREVMMLYKNLNRKEDAIAQYQLLAEQLKKNLGVAPDNATKELYDQIKSS